MEEKQIRGLAALMKEAGLTLLELSEGGFRLRMERGPLGPAAEFPVKAEPAGDSAPEPEEAGLFTVTSPMVGLFYGAGAQGARPFVSRGDKVRAGDVVCVVEAMKMMNEITAGVDGIVAEICAGDGQIVEYGHPLIRIRQETAEA
ncbi:MAG TPA: acetyl-CoA carboxylase, biotin carboxyl carrier protein [Oscillospiraceae bacterium]|nr:acetyl-CoA carboxylase, biotin carboxyl carrier protein [Oscillospiraceae bacterium]